MCGADVGDSVSVVVQLIIQIENRASWIAKNRVDLLLQQAFHYNFCASHFHKHVSFSVYLTKTAQPKSQLCGVLRISDAEDSASLPLHSEHDLLSYHQPLFFSNCYEKRAWMVHRFSIGSY
jgi:hypothetical protein